MDASSATPGLKTIVAIMIAARYAAAPNAGLVAAMLSTRRAIRSDSLRLYYSEK